MITRRGFLAGMAGLTLMGSLPLKAGDLHGRKRLVVFIRYRIEPNHFGNVVSMFKSRMAELGYLEGRDLEYVDVVTRSADKRSIPDVVDAVLKYRDRADLFVTCGWVSMYARRILEGTQVPQFFVPVLKSVALTMLPSVTKPPHTNLTGLYLMYPPEKILRLAKATLPSLKRYAYVYDSRIPADVVFMKAYRGLDARQRHGVEVHLLDLANGVEWVVDKMCQQSIGCFGGIVGVFKNRDRLFAVNTPVVTSFTLDIEEKDIARYVKGTNVVAGLFNSFGYCGAQAAEMAHKLFSGRSTIGQLVPEPARQVAFANLDAANRLGIYVSIRVLEAVDLVVR